MSEVPLCTIIIAGYSFACMRLLDVKCRCTWKIGFYSRLEAKIPPDPLYRGTTHTEAPPPPQDYYLYTS